MEEDLKLLEEMKNNCLTKRDYIDEKAERKAQAIENLINKCKELEKERDDIYADYQDLGKEKLKLEEKCEELKKNYKKLLESAEILKEASEEQEKMVELMAEYIDFDKMNFNCSSLCVKEGCREECIIEFFRKKAR